MRKQIFLLPFLLLLLISPFADANPIVIYPPHIPVRDYVRGTYGEPLYIDNTKLVGIRTFRITNELRYCDYNTYWDADGQKRDLSQSDYYRFVNFLNIDYGVSEYMEIGARLYYLASDLEGVENDFAISNEGFGDFLLRVRVNPFDIWRIGIPISFGVSMKFPTGEYEIPMRGHFITNSLPTGTGSRDVSFMAYGNHDLKLLELHASLGYVITGGTEHYGFNGDDWDVQDLNLGDVFSYDLALSRRLTSLMSAIVEFNGYAMGSSKNDDGNKIEDPSHRLSIAPGVAISIPRANLTIEGGFSHDLMGKNTLRGTSPLLRLKFTGQIPI